VIPTAASLLAGANDPHGHHERADQGWDQWLRRHTPDTADALVYGRHARPEPPQEKP
jgi:hypothetical protein